MRFYRKISGKIAAIKRPEKMRVFAKSRTLLFIILACFLVFSSVSTIAFGNDVFFRRGVVDSPVTIAPFFDSPYHLGVVDSNSSFERAISASDPSATGSTLSFDIISINGTPAPTGWSLVPDSTLPKRRVKLTGTMTDLDDDVSYVIRVKVTSSVTGLSNEGDFTLNGKAVFNPDAGIFTDASDVTPATEQNSNNITLGGFSGSRSLSVVAAPSGFAFIKNGIVSGSSVMVRSGDSIALRLTSSPDFATENAAEIRLNGQLLDIWNVTTRAAMAPSFTTSGTLGANYANEAFSFQIDATDEPLRPSSTLSFEIVSITGTPAPTGWALAAGPQPARNTLLTGTIPNLSTDSDYVVRVRASSSATGLSSTADFTLNGLDVFAPVAISFTDRSNRPRNTAHSSNTVTLSGFSGTRSLTVATPPAGFAFIKNNSNVGTSTSVVDGDNIALTMLSASTEATTLNAAISLDGQLLDTWSVTTGSAPVWVTSVNLGSTTANTAFSIPVEASDADGDTLSFSITGITGTPTASGWSLAARDTVSRLFTGTGTNVASNTVYTVTIQASDPQGETASRAFSFTVGDVFSPPTLTYSNLTGQNFNSIVNSPETRILSGFSGSRSLTGSVEGGGGYSFIVNGTNIGTSGMVSANDSLRLEIQNGASAGVTRTLTVSLDGAQIATWSSTTAACTAGSWDNSSFGATGTGGVSVVVPSGCGTVTLQAWGAGGGYGYGAGGGAGAGGYGATTTNSLSGGRTFVVYIGQAGTNSSTGGQSVYAGGNGGTNGSRSGKVGGGSGSGGGGGSGSYAGGAGRWGGGGGGSNDGGTGYTAGGGGGASVIRENGTDIVIGGGGGGEGTRNDSNGGLGGAGGSGCSGGGGSGTTANSRRGGGGGGSGGCLGSSTGIGNGASTDGRIRIAWSP